MFDYMASIRKSVYNIARSVRGYMRDCVFFAFESFPLSRWGIPYLSGVLVIRLDAIGDFIIWLDAAKEIRRTYPGKKITLLANEAWADLATHFDYWDEVIPCSLKDLINKPLYRWKMLRRIRKAGYDIVIQTQFSRVFLACDSTVRATGARERIGSMGDMANITPHQKRISDRWYTRLLPAFENPLMEVERNAEFIRGLTGNSFEPRISLIPPLLELPSRCSLDRPYWIVFPGASAIIRQWPVDRFASLIDRVADQYGIVPVLCGAPSERLLCAEVALHARAECLDYSGQTLLPELIEVVRHARFLVGNETSAVHIAAAVGTPSVCILGGGHYGRFMPYPDHLEGVKPLVAMSRMDCFNCNWVCEHTDNRDEPYPCITGVSVEQVMAMVERILDPSVGYPDRECSAKRLS